MPNLLQDLIALNDQIDLLLKEGSPATKKLRKAWERGVEQEYEKKQPPLKPGETKYPTPRGVRIQKFAASSIPETPGMLARGRRLTKMRFASLRKPTPAPVVQSESADYPKIEDRMLALLEGSDDKPTRAWKDHAKRFLNDPQYTKNLTGEQEYISHHIMRGQRYKGNDPDWYYDTIHHKFKQALAHHGYEYNDADEVVKKGGE